MYLSSYDYSRIDPNYIITNLDDTSTFREWWTWTDKSTKFNVARNCESCKQSIDPALYDNVVYYTDSLHFAYTTYIGTNACQDDVNSYSCNICDIGAFADKIDDHSHNPSQHWSQCTALQVSADTPSWHEPQMRVNHHLIYRPIMSLTRDFCACYKKLNEPIKHYDIFINDLPSVTFNGNQVPPSLQIMSIDNLYIDDNIKLQDIHVCDPQKEDCEQDVLQKRKNCAQNIVYLTQNEFKSGTYRIRKCGEYIFTEDVTCNFNPPSIQEQAHPNFSPNRIDGDELYWFPTNEQANNNNEYPGLYKYVGSFSLGFFAGITIEVENVIINLNGHSFKMDKTFYLQQRFFSLIELSSKMFLPIQGPSTWGFDNEFYANNVEIKGGTLGISSHHGIHGNYAQNVYIHDLEIQHFDVAGIACNGCKNIRIERVSIGPQNNQIPTLGRYTHARAFLPRLKHLNDKFGQETIKFYNREQTTVSALCQRMVQQMDMIYLNWIHNKEYDDNDEEWIAAKKIFKNPTGWMDGGSSYGLVINGRGAAVVGIGVRVENTWNITINDIEIFGIYNKAIEKIKFQVEDSYTTRGILFDTIDWIAVTDQIEDRSKSQYIGDVYTDVQFAAAKFVDSWYYRNSYYVGTADVEFVFKGNNKEFGYPFLSILPQRDDFWNDEIIRSCGTDIQLHSSKGAIGMMVNGAQESSFNNLYIHDIYNWADLGMEVCGPYDLVHITFEDIDIQYGYTGTTAHGLVIDFTSGDYTNIKIENVQSYYGEANGMTIYKESYVNLGNIVVNNVNAGTQLTEQDIDALVLPNSPPKACAVDIHDDTDIHYIDGDAVDNLFFDGINGYSVCDPLNAAKQLEANQQFVTSLTALFGLLMVVLFVVVAFAICKLCKRVCFHDDDTEKEKFKKRKTRKLGEKTPLLTPYNQSDSLIINNRL